MTFALLCGALASSAMAAERPVAIVLYDGFGTEKQAWLSGRVLVDRGLDEPRRGESHRAKFRRMRRLMDSDEVPAARVQLRVAGRSHAVVADDEGLFEWHLRGPLPVGRHAISATLPGHKRQRTLPGSLAVFPARPATAVISDFDDTVAITDVTKKGRMIRRLATTNALDMRPVPGAASRYGGWAARGWPVIFVSGSPVNLQPRLKRFLAHQRIPCTALMLKNLGAGPGADSLFAHLDYKVGRIERIMTLLPGWRFVLVGDSGERDPEVYAEVRRRHPKQVEAVWIRRVPGDGRKDALPAGMGLVPDWRAMPATRP